MARILAKENAETFFSGTGGIPFCGAVVFAVSDAGAVLVSGVASGGATGAGAWGSGTGIAAAAVAAFATGSAITTGSFTSMEAVLLIK
ncbi:hypothetical protein [Flavobacterium kingsejongi]|uniref:hypothetical protein n=1 Tax=Flavobacterium kingsejongi TaxID=1678728 RepID=UPI0013001F60|nr:hypothetical protein [Flavobacterium kingsejongi]